MRHDVAPVQQQQQQQQQHQQQQYARGRVKKVTFGTENEAIVETFVYDQAPTCDKGDPYELRHNDEPSLILVTAVESKSPLYIAPPVATHQPDSPESQSLTGHSSLLTTSPKRTMAQEKDNPFRPDGQLCHEVDPIVKKYTSRPFPESNVVSAQPVGILPPDEGVDGGGGRRSSPDELNKADKLSPIKLNMLNGEQVQTLQAQHKSLASPKAGTLELVHVEPRKKRCGCCSVQ
ncbi:hypothetical protein T4A_7298 [Trichinella pseudospiralis]|uniref:Uncharacterized protein n=1 Tax=Trichinella pseudospiralis TaxID=6337 RepID=A0A0V1JW02_TRIPS|nr:hypothetical protein T4A_7298 [Trichinella pseudospiralis]KRZ39171.1 hypothetical protein T4C_12938 [Trichinella pseudospiralis]